MRQSLLLGFTKDGDVVFGEVEYKNGEFSASFDISHPMEATKELAIAIIQDSIDQMDKDWVMDKLKTYDCKPCELVKHLYDDTCDIVEELFAFSIDGVEDDFYFMSSSCGQHDTREEMSIYINKELYDEVHNLWDEYHLKEIPFEKVEKVLEAIEHQNNTIDDYRVVENWLKRTFIKS